MMGEGAALVVVDMQVGFLDDDSAMARIGFDLAPLRAVIEPCRRAVATARTAGMPVIWTRYIFAPDHADGGVMVDLVPGLREEGALRRGDREVEIAPGFDVRPDDIIVDKNRPSAFFGTALDTIVADRRIDRLLVCGVTTNCCVESTVRDAAHRDIPVFVIADAVAETATDRHENALKAMGMLFARLVTIADVERAALGDIAA